MSLAQVDDRDMAECQTWNQAIAVNWRRSSAESAQMEMSAASAPAAMQGEQIAMRSYNSLQNEC